MVKAIFFDFDGVLTLDRNDGLTTPRNLSKATGIDVGIVRSCYGKFIDQLDAGLVTHEGIWPEFQVCIGKNIEYDLINRAFRDVPVNDAMFTLARELKQAGYSVGLISNTTAERAAVLVDVLKLDKIFNPIVISAQVKCTKGGERGGERIFNIALNGLDPHDAIFIDNTKENLVIPEKTGMQTIYFDGIKNDISKLRNELQTFGVRISETSA